jgi:hypothetical protein
MRQLATEQSFPEERLLINELTHRINNEFASAISLVSLAAVRSSNREVKVALTSVVELLHHYQMCIARCRCRNIELASTLRRTLNNCACPSADPSWIS